MCIFRVNYVINIYISLSIRILSLHKKTTKFINTNDILYIIDNFSKLAKMYILFS